MSGVVGDRVIELGTCWALAMAVTGYYLFLRGWKVRRRNQQRGRPGAGLRSRHGLLGSFVGVGLLFMVVSGLPWTGLWGAQVQKLATTSGTSMWSLDHGAVSKPSSTLDESLPHSHAELPWALQESEVPDGAKPGDEVSVANLDTAVAVGAREGLRHPMTVALPAEENGTFTTRLLRRDHRQQLRPQGVQSSGLHRVRRLLVPLRELWTVAACDLIPLQVRRV